MSCVICVENINNSTHKTIRCQYCPFEACRTCCQQYILSNDSTCCMNAGKLPNGSLECGKEWTREFMVNNFPKTFVAGDWKKMLEKVGIDRQKALLPATMNVVEHRAEVDKMKKEILEIDEIIKGLVERKANIRHQIYTGASYNAKDEKVFQRACVSENCRGFLDKNWNCALCEKKTCSSCNVLKESDHVCNEDEKASFELLKKDTKACVTCQVPIHKIEGCDQMWCTQCHTAFSWKTGRIETKIHNPHFFEFQRTTNGGVAPRNANDIECGREVTHTIWTRILRAFKLKVSDKQTTFEGKQMTTRMEVSLTEVFRRLAHTQYEELGRYQTNNIADHLELRVSYLKSEIDDATFAARVQKNQKAFEKKQDMFNILRLIIQLVTDATFVLLDQFTIVEVKDPLVGLGYANTFMQQIDNITKYSNDLLVRHSKIFTSISKKVVLYGAMNDEYDVLVSCDKAKKVEVVVKVEGIKA